MDQNDLNKLRFPVGKFSKPLNIEDTHVQKWITEIEEFPSQLKDLVSGLKETELKAVYRPGGWNIAQVVHHCADSHMNSFIRFKWALTEDNPTIKAYYQERWAKLPDGTSLNIKDSLDLLTSLHSKWTLLLKRLSTEQLDRTFIHPENNKTYTLKENIGVYAWHGKHHLAHIRIALNN